MKKIVLAVLVISLLAILVYAFTSRKQEVHQQQPQSNNTQALLHPTLPIESVQTKAGSNNTRVYSGKYFSVTFPDDSWKAAQGIVCGQEDVDEHVAVYYPKAAKSQNPLTVESITVCATLQKENEERLTDSQLYNRHKSALQEQLKEGLLNSLQEQTVASQNALVYDFERKDFPGHYEKTILFVKNGVVYHVVWSIQTDSKEEEDRLKAQTVSDYQNIVSSLRLL